VAFSSAGSHGFLFQGVLDALEECLPEYDKWYASLKGIAGTSSGAIVALIFALSLSHEKRDAIFTYLSDMKNILQCPDVTLMISNYGFDDGNALRGIVRDILTYGGLSPTTTMADLRRLLKVEVVFIAHDLMSCSPVHLSALSVPHMFVYDAVYCSCAIPIVFAPLKYGNTLLCDGVMTESVPNVFPAESTFFVIVPPLSCKTCVNSWHDMMHCFSRIAVAPQRARIDLLMTLPNTLIAYHPLMESVPTLDLYMSNKKAQDICRLGYMATLLHFHLDSVSTVLSATIRLFLESGKLTSSTEAPPDSEDEY